MRENIIIICWDFVWHGVRPCREDKKGVQWATSLSSENERHVYIESRPSSFHYLGKDSNICNILLPSENQAWWLKMVAWCCLLAQFQPNEDRVGERALWLVWSFFHDVRNNGDRSGCRRRAKEQRWEQQKKGATRTRIGDRSEKRLKHRGCCESAFESSVVVERGHVW